MAGIPEWKRIHSKKTTDEQMREIIKIEIRDLKKRLSLLEMSLADLNLEIKARK